MTNKNLLRAQLLIEAADILNESNTVNKSEETYKQVKSKLSELKQQSKKLTRNYPKDSALELIKELKDECKKLKDIVSKMPTKCTNKESWKFSILDGLKSALIPRDPLHELEGFEKNPYKARAFRMINDFMYYLNAAEKEYQKITQ